MCVLLLYAMVKLVDPMVNVKQVIFKHPICTCVTLKLVHACVCVCVSVCMYVVLVFFPLHYTKAETDPQTLGVTEGDDFFLFVFVAVAVV